MPQVDEVGQPGLLVRRDRRGDLHHLHERDGALLHPGAAGDRRGEQRQPLGGRALDGAHQPLGGGDADRAGQEPELAGHHRHPPPAHQALAGDHRLVEPGPLRARRPARRRTPRRPGRAPAACPRRRTSLVEHQVDQVRRGQPVAHVPDDVASMPHVRVVRDEVVEIRAGRAIRHGRRGACRFSACRPPPTTVDLDRVDDLEGEDPLGLLVAEPDQHPGRPAAAPAGRRTGSVRRGEARPSRRPTGRAATRPVHRPRTTCTSDRARPCGHRSALRGGR